MRECNDVEQVKLAVHNNLNTNRSVNRELVKQLTLTRSIVISGNSSSRTEENIINQSVIGTIQV